MIQRCVRNYLILVYDMIASGDLGMGFCDHTAPKYSQLPLAISVSGSLLIELIESSMVLRIRNAFTNLLRIHGQGGHSINSINSILGQGGHKKKPRKARIKNGNPRCTRYQMDGLGLSRDKPLGNRANKPRRVSQSQMEPVRKWG